MKKPLLLGLLASFFFAFTFLLNRSIHLSGGHWLWSACLRYFFMLPPLALWVKFTSGFGRLWAAIRQKPAQWILWSCVGFGLFYAPLTYASAHGTAWLVAATWQITLVAGVLLTPLFGQPIPRKNLFMSFVVLTGVFLLNLPADGDFKGFSLSVLAPVLVAAVAYPLGNRKMMQHSPETLTTPERVLGMTLCSMVFWVPLALFAYGQAGLPGKDQLVQSALVALFSGVAATLLFFRATDLSKRDPKLLALIEATQSGEVLFSLLGGVLLLKDPLPSPLGVLGLLLVLAGMVGSSLAVRK